MILIALLVALLAPSQEAACDTAAGCREAALAAAARGDFESFHDLAWRAVQRGRRNDPDLMFLLARAQSLSGRPGDALVMVRRLAEMGVPTDAPSHPDFENVRKLASWPEVEAAIAALLTPPLETASLPGAPPDSAPATTAASSAGGKPPAPSSPAPPSAAAPPRPAARAATPSATVPSTPPSPAVRGELARRLARGPVDAAGMAYDGASRRFVLGDRRLNKLIVADEVFDQVNDLIGALAGGFGSLTALAIDSRRGDLWVTSSAAGGGASIHRLQLVSGRLLSTMEVPAEWHPVTIADLAVDEAGTLLLLDAAGSRLLVRRSAGGPLRRAATLGVSGPTSLALTGTTAYIAHQDGIIVTDTASGRTQPLQVAAGLSLTGLQRIRSHDGALVGIQSVDGQGDRLVRIRLARGGARAAGVDVLDDHTGSAGTALAISRDAAYYLVDDEGVQVIRRVPLK